jgi:hypothetical protein
MKKIPILNYKDNDLKEFAESCKRALLLENPYEFNYPTILKNNTEERLWKECIPKIKEKNKNLLSKLRSNANLYTIYERKSKVDKWLPVYVGERKSVGMRERITQHLINKNLKTGSKLEEVKEIVRTGGKIGVSFIKIEPESLRLYVEEYIINNSSKENLNLEWNKHGKCNTK